MKHENRRLAEYVIRELRAVNVGISKAAASQHADTIQKIVDHEADGSKGEDDFSAGIKYALSQPVSNDAIRAAEEAYRVGFHMKAAIEAALEAMRASE